MASTRYNFILKIYGVIMSILVENEAPKLYTRGAI